MAISYDKAMEIAEAYTAAWNSGAPEAVAEFYAEDGRIDQSWGALGGSHRRHRTTVVRLVGRDPPLSSRPWFTFGL
jgi:hypothetical protein